ncbi:MAG: hypothetical protein PHH14_04740 [Candidatus Margulisbacteria bacterium]|nr:hypothetical protein [Candidatus Margulisiibacteriota bacterium]
MQKFIASLQGHPEIMIEILRQLRSEADPLFYPEKIMDCKTTEEITKLINSLPPKASRDKAALRFFLKFVAAVKKTDYFDLNRLSELFSFTLETSPLLPFLANQEERIYFPSEIIYNFKVNGEMFFVPIAAAEKRLSGNRFSDNRCLTAFPAPALPSLLRSQAQVYDDTFLALADSILPPKPRDHLQKLLYRIGYIDEEGRRYNTQFLGGNKYFNLCTRAIFSQVTDDGQPHNEPNYLFDIASKMGIVPQHIDRVEIRLVDQGAIKDISRVVIYGPDKIKRSFAVAIEKSENAGEKSDPVKDEYELFNMMRKKTPLVPSPFGFTTLPFNDYKNVSILFREFLFGIDGLKYLGRIKKDWIIDSFFYQVGLAMSTLYAETGMGTSDFKLKNLIFDYERRNLRFCDVLPISDDFDDVIEGFKNEVDEIEDFAPRSLPYFFAGILGNREKGKEFLTRARNYLYYSDTNDACFSVPIRRSIDEYIIKQGYRPNSFFRLE